MNEGDHASAAVPVLRISIANALLVSGLYLVLALAAELVGRVWNPRWLTPFAQNLEAFPARVLHLLGLLEPLRGAYLEGQLSNFGMRLCYGAVTVAVMMVIGLVIGLVMWLFQKVLSAKSV